MTANTSREELLDRLTQVVSAFGGNPERWTAADRAMLIPFVSNDGAAQDLVRNANAVDQLLELAAPEPAGAQSYSEMADRLMQRAEAQDVEAQKDEAETADAGSGSSADILAFPAGRPTHPGSGRAADADPDRGVPSWMLASALAASLVLGVFIGASGLLEKAASGVTELAGLSSTVEPVNSPVEDGFGPVDEEFL